MNNDNIIRYTIIMVTLNSMNSIEDIKNGTSKQAVCSSGCIFFLGVSAIVRDLELYGPAISIDESAERAEEVVLCVSEANQYIVTVNEKGDCLEDESRVVLSGSGMDAKKSMTPLANFKSSDDCDGEGATTEIGFDENEIDSTSATCAPLVLAEEESAEPVESSGE